MATIFYKQPISEPDSPRSASSAAVAAPRQSRLSRKLKAVILSISMLAATVLLGVWWFGELPLVSPLTSNASFRFLAGETLGANTDKEIYGFLPYWNLNQVTAQPEMTTLAYFSLTIGGDGSIILREDDHLEPGYNKLQSDTFLDLSTVTLAQNKKLDLVVTQFNNDDIVNFLGSSAAQDRFLDSLDAVLLAYPFTGVNIDIEYSGPLSDELRDNLSTFVRRTNAHLDSKYQNIQLSIDMYAGAAKNNGFWDVAAIAPEVDYIVIMAYDFHRKSSPQAGPVAPLFGGKEYWDSDISEHLAAFLQKAPSNKLLLGVPFYGYGWQTTSREPQAHTFPDTGSTATFKRVQELLSQAEEYQVQEHWNEEALSPYISYQQDGQTYVIYYENSRSLSYKLDFVNQLDLAGIAIWAVGYESDSRELWDVINRKLTAQ